MKNLKKDYKKNVKIMFLIASISFILVIFVEPKGAWKVIYGDNCPNVYTLLPCNIIGILLFLSAIVPVIYLAVTHKKSFNIFTWKKSSNKKINQKPKKEF